MNTSNDHHRRTDHTHDHADTHTLSHTVIFAGSEILSHKGSYRHSKAGHRQEGKTFYLRISSAACHGHFTECIDVGLYKHVAMAMTEFWKPEGTPF